MGRVISEEVTFKNHVASSRQGKSDVTTTMSWTVSREVRGHATSLRSRLRWPPVSTRPRSPSGSADMCSVVRLGQTILRGIGSGRCFDCCYKTGRSWRWGSLNVPKWSAEVKRTNTNTMSNERNVTNKVVQIRGQMIKFAVKCELSGVWWFVLTTYIEDNGKNKTSIWYIVLMLQKFTFC